MRIALFTDTFPPEVNGVAHSVARSAEALAKRGHDVSVFTVSKSTLKALRMVSGGRYAVETIPSIGIPIYLGVRTTIPIGLALRKVSRFKPDIIHSHTPFSVGWEAVWAARFLGVPLVGTHHTFFDHYLKHVHLDYKWARRFSWKITVGYYNRCNMVISPTLALAEELRANGLIRPHELVRNIVDINFFRPSEEKSALKNRFGLSPKVVIHMGRLSYEKSVDQVLRAFALVLKEISDAMLVIAGDGPSKKELETLTRTLGLAEKVRFTGFIHGRDLVEHLQASDVFVTASKSENMPLAVLEAMATGLPIIAVRSLGLTEIVEEGKSGYLVAQDDVEMIARRAVELLCDDRARRALGERSRTLSETYSESSVVEKLEDLYVRLFEEKR